MAKSREEKDFGISGYLIIAMLFVLIVIVLLGIRRTVELYKTVAYEEYTENQEETFIDVVNGAIALGESGVNNSSLILQRRLNEEMNMDKLRVCLSSGVDYPEFEAILRDTLQTNVFTHYGLMNANRNSIIVIANERIIASYTHDGTIYSSGAKVSSNLNIKNMIEENFYNSKLGLDSLNKIENQYTGVIIWQSREPQNPDIPKYTSMTFDDIVYIFNKFGVEGLESFDIIIPAYITEYGNIFGDYDIPGETSRNSDNKIIILQKLNLTDYINSHFPRVFSKNTITKVLQRFNTITDIINLLIVLNCICVIAYSFTLASMYNNYNSTIKKIERVCNCNISENDKIEERIDK